MSSGDMRSCEQDTYAAGTCSTSFSAKSLVHHIAIICSDYAKAKRFYVAQLGFAVICETHRENDWKIVLQGAGCEIELFVKPDAPPYPKALGLSHLVFCVESVENTVEWLLKRGISCEPIRPDSSTGDPKTFFYAPDGLPLEIYEIYEIYE
jgi:glyoxylase I family protein